MDHSDLKPDTLNDIGVLKRREIEARIIAPLVERLSQEFGRDRVLEILREVIVNVARDQGKQLSLEMGGDSPVHLADSLEAWTRDNALEIEVLERSPTRLFFDVKRCRYAELYEALGIPELGEILSCSRDSALSEGFNPGLRLRRTQTILGGASCCDFRYSLRDDSAEEQT